MVEIAEATSPRKVFTCSWGQLEGRGSNLGDRVILESQILDLQSEETIGCDLEVGVASSDPEHTATSLGVRPFSTARGRVAAMLRGISWADAVIVGGGELVQDSSSLLYSPFNLLPVLASRFRSKPCFAWAIGVGQGEELRPWTRRMLRMALGGAAGTTVRDDPSRSLLLKLGVPDSKVWKTADCAFRFCDRYRAGPVESDMLGVAPRNVSVRQGKLLPIETRRKLGLHREPDPVPRRRAWASVLDRHIDRCGGRIRFFPFHTGSLSSSDHVECTGIAELMRNREATEIIDTGGSSLDMILDAFAGCRVTLGVPLHSSILAIVAGSLPVAVPYASKGVRFMREAGLGELCLERGALSNLEQTDVLDAAEAVLDNAWSNTGGLWSGLTEARQRLANESRENVLRFAETCLNC